MQRKTFIFHEEWRNTIRDLPKSVRLEIYEATIEYGLSGIVPDGLKQAAEIAFRFIKKAIDKDAEKYEAICRRNRSNGSKSKGRPKNPNKHQKPTGFPSDETDNKKPLETPINKGDSEEKPTGLFGFSADKSQTIKESPLTPPNKENTPTPLKEIIPPISPKENTEKRAKFKKPTIEEVRAYIWEKGYDIDAEAFWCYYEANGWVQGRAQKPIKNWKACVTTWHKNSKNYGTNQQSNPQASPTDIELLGQTHRIMQQLRAERLASQG